MVKVQQMQITLTKTKISDSREKFSLVLMKEVVSYNGPPIPSKEYYTCMQMNAIKV